MNEKSPIRVLVADDHPVVREGLVALIEHRADMTVVAQASNGQEAIALFQRHQPDVTLLDLRMPEIDGLVALAAIRETFPEARIIIVTTYEGDEDIYRSLRAGAKGYLLKDTPREALIEAIIAVHKGQRWIPTEVATKLAERIGMPDLTQREVEVLRLLVAGKSNKEVGEALAITEGTVKAHVNNILDKLGVSDRTQAVTTALKRGIVRLE